jgi:hypothetical protein
MIGRRGIERIGYDRRAVAGVVRHGKAGYSGWFGSRRMKNMVTTWEKQEVRLLLAYDENNESMTVIEVHGAAAEFDHYQGLRETHDKWEGILSAPPRTGLWICTASAVHDVDGNEYANEKYVELSREEWMSLSKGVRVLPPMVGHWHIETLSTLPAPKSSVVEPEDVSAE